MHSNRYTLLFTAIITIVLASLLSLADSSLKEKFERNVDVDIKKNILGSLGFKASDDSPWTNEDVESIFQNSIVGFVVDNSGFVVEDKLPEDIDPSIVTQDNILGTPSVNRVGRYGLRRRAATAPPVMDNSTTTSSSDDEFTPYSPGMRILRGDSDSESPERPRTGRHNSSHLGGSKRKTLRKRKKRRKKITIKRK